MAFGFILILFLIGITFRNHTASKHNLKNPVWSNTKRLVIVSCITLIPFVFINLLVPEEIKYSDTEIMYREKNTDPEVFYQAIESERRIYPDSIDLQLIHFKMFQQLHDGICLSVVDSRACKNPANSKILLEFTNITCDEEISFYKKKYIGLDTINGNHRGLNYVKALGNLKLDNSKSAIIYLKKEIKANPDFTFAYVQLAKMYYWDHPKKYYTFLKVPNVKHILPDEQWLSFYFINGHYLDFIQGIYYSRLSTVKLFPFISSLFISLVWLFFLRSLDFFKKEKWRNIIIVFLLGTSLTFMCLFFYYLAEITFDFRLNGSGWNDFFYCVFVIGGSEELVKLLPWLLFGTFIKRFEEPFDYIFYASVSALGFAFAENWIYLESAQNIVMRSIMAVVGHMFDASLIATGFILARFHFKTLWKKIAIILLGFLAGMFSHGFYDFWLITPSTNSLFIITLLFFIFTLHAWFYMKNVAINYSSFFISDHGFNREKLQDIFTFSIISILILEFSFISIEFGTLSGNLVLGLESIVIAVFIFYISMLLFKMDFRKEIWIPYRINIPFLGDVLSKGGINKFSKSNLAGLQLHLRTISNTTKMGVQFPVTGTCIRSVTLNDNPNWYVFQLDKPVIYEQNLVNIAVVKNRFGKNTLQDENIEIIYLFVPNIDVLEKEKLIMGDLIYVERVFSEPII